MVDDQITGDDEEHVDADKAAGNEGNVCVKGNDGEHRDRTQTVDVGNAVRFAAGGGV